MSTRTSSEPVVGDHWTLSSAGREQILSMERGSDWDGEGAREITRDACEAAILFAQLAESRSLRAPDSIGPSTSGAIGFTWKSRAEQINVQVFSLAEHGCLVRRAGTVRSKSECSISEAIDNLDSFLALDRGR
jgi:hypothetical protein